LCFPQGFGGVKKNGEIGENTMQSAKITFPITLKELYKEIYSNDEYFNYAQVRHKNFKSFVERVRHRIEELKNGRIFDIKNYDDKDILQKILVQIGLNGVASTGPYLTGIRLSKDEWTEYIMNNKKFIDCLQDYMKNPDDEFSFNQLYANCKYNVKNSIINRIAATCTQNVSSTIKEKIFNDVVKYLENKKIIPPGSVSSRKTWFSKNRELMKIINEQLEGLLVDGKPLDKYQKAIFVWHIKEYCIDKRKEPCLFH